MILIADGGSTKCDWVLLDSSGNTQFKTTTKGLNPAVLPKAELSKRIKENQTLGQVFNEIKKVDFYGAGCGTPIPAALFKDVLSSIFTSAEVNIYEDTLAAVYATTNSPGIVCILGTGSNSCYFDGKNVSMPIASLGYIIMDEASGSYFGRQLIRDYYYKIMPADLSLQFSKTYNLDADEIKSNIFQKPHPNAYLASFTQFIFTSPKGVKEPYFHQLLKEGISKFINYRILSFENAHDLPIHFVGSVAHFSKEIIAECFLEKNLKLGNIIQRPIDGLIEYYRRKI
ncbi:MAG TPA: hypothetical protein VKX34_09430 [Aequorivita sp.]|nr:hypothetical protein [Aequorivita sp.]